MSQFPEPCFVKWLREYIDKLVFGTYIRQVNISSSNMIPDEVMANLNVLRLVVLHRVVGYLDSTLVHTIERLCQN